MAKILSKKKKRKCQTPVELARAAGFVVREIHPWRVQIVYYLLDDFDKIKDLFPDAEDARPCGACVNRITVDDWDLVLFGIQPGSEPAVTAGRLAHESVHAMNWIFHSRGQKLDPMNDEVMAYSVEMLTIWGVWAIEAMVADDGKK